VDGFRISKSQWHKRLESSYGSTIAQQLIDEAIIKKEAKKEGITVSKEEVQSDLDEIITSIGGEESYKAALVANNITEEELKDQIQLDLLMTKILTPTLKYTEDDVKEFFNQYSDVIFPEETEALEKGEKLDYDQLKEKTLKVYLQQQVQNQKSSWLTEKGAEYKIQDNSTNKPAYGFLTTTTNIINNLIEDLNK
jgi:foldase protein PrsA